MHNMSADYKKYVKNEKKRSIQINRKALPQHLKQLAIHEEHSTSSIAHFITFIGPLQYLNNLLRKQDSKMGSPKNHT